MLPLKHFIKPTEHHDMWARLPDEIVTNNGGCPCRTCRHPKSFALDVILKAQVKILIRSKLWAEETR